MGNPVRTLPAPTSDAARQRLRRERIRDGKVVLRVVADEVALEYWLEEHGLRTDDLAAGLETAIAIMIGDDSHA